MATKNNCRVPLSFRSIFGTCQCIELNFNVNIILKNTLSELHSAVKWGLVHNVLWFSYMKVPFSDLKISQLWIRKRRSSIKTENKVNKIMKCSMYSEQRGYFFGSTTLQGHL